MEREYILNLSSLVRVKQKVNVPIKYKLNRLRKNIKIKNIELNKSLFVFKIPKFTKTIFKLKSKRQINKNKYQIKIKYSPYLYLLTKLDFTNSFVLENIELLYNLFSAQLDKYNYEEGYFENNTENIIKIIKYHEKMILNDNDIEQLRDLSNYIKCINKIVINYIEMFLY